MSGSVVSAIAGPAVPTVWSACTVVVATVPVATGGGGPETGGATGGGGGGPGIRLASLGIPDENPGPPIRRPTPSPWPETVTPPGALLTSVRGGGPEMVTVPLTTGGRTDTVTLSDDVPTS